MTIEDVRSTLEKIVGHQYGRVNISIHSKQNFENVQGRQAMIEQNEEYYQRKGVKNQAAVKKEMKSGDNLGDESEVGGVIKDGGIQIVEHIKKPLSFEED